MRYFCLAVLLILLSNRPAVMAQSLPMPRDIRAAYQNGTRSFDGKPPAKYWQNTANYDIQITALPPDRLISGSETITYFNHSPDTLDHLVIKLILNIHQPGAPRVEGANPEYLTSGIHIDSFAVNRQAVAWENSKDDFTWKAVDLPQPLPPGDSVRLAFNWHYQISQESGREGMIDSTTYFLAYFYPRVAVYDDYQGWDQMNFTDFHEFYNDFNNYRVRISVPKNFIVFGTGTLQHPETLLQPACLQRYRRSFLSDSIVAIASGRDIRSGAVTLQNQLNVWEFKGSHLPDMTFGLSDHFNWDASSVTAGGRRISIQAAYNDTAKDFHQMAAVSRHAVRWLSDTLPGIPFPYEKMTVFQGFAGMEYPMMANVETDDDLVFSRYVTEHEIAHMYLPFYAGINETRYGFMDEGWATLAELLMTRDNVGQFKADSMIRRFRIKSWAGGNSALLDIPIITPSDAMAGRAMRVNQYGKTMLGLLILQDMLGDAVFKKCFRGFLERWQGKHPTPWDLFYTFDQISGQNLDWFWQNWFFTPYYVDLGIRNILPGRSGYQLLLSNTGRMASSGDIRVHFTDGTIQQVHFTAAAWKRNAQATVIHLLTTKHIKSAVLTVPLGADAKPSNNRWTHQ